MRLAYKGLCKTCYDKPSVREAYPAFVPKRGGKRHWYRQQKVDLSQWHPTTALPGSMEKVLVLEQRASLGLPLFHPCDAKEDLRRGIRWHQGESRFIGCETVEERAA
jgi:hypothetical protein